MSQRYSSKGFRNKLRLNATRKKRTINAGLLKWIATRKRICRTRNASTATATQDDQQNRNNGNEVVKIEMEVLPDGTLTTLSTDFVSPSRSCVVDNTTFYNSDSNIDPSFSHLLNPLEVPESKPSTSDLQDFTTSTPRSIKTEDREEEEDEITDALADFFFGCNIPLLTVESVHFKNFIKKLHPAYAEKLPDHKQISTTILNKSYERCITKARNTLNTQSVLLIDSWKNSSSNSKTVVSMVHTSDKKQAFLDTYDVTTESETEEKLCEFVTQSIHLANYLYNTNIYAVVSDNTSSMVKTGKLMKHIIWHTACNSHIGNSLAKDVTNETLNENVSTVLKEFKHPDLEKLVVNKGGYRIQLPVETRWCSYKDSNQCLLTNLRYMRLIAEERKINQQVCRLIFDDDFVREVEESVEWYSSICHLINKCQSIDCSLADAAALWLDFQLPEKFENCLKERKKMALNELAIAAYFFHPHYDNEKLNMDQKRQLNHFLLTNLDGKGLEEYDLYNTKSEIFGTLYEKCIQNPFVFWRMAEIDYPNVTKMAIKLLSIPASSAQLERIFSSWTHTPLRNRLTFEMSKKLMHIYYTLRLSDTIPKDVFEDNLDEDML